MLPTFLRCLSGVIINRFENFIDLFSLTLSDMNILNSFDFI